MYCCVSASFSFLSSLPNLRNNEYLTGKQASHFKWETVACASFNDTCQKQILSAVASKLIQLVLVENAVSI